MLTLIPTPIGNLGDISFRTIEVLKDTEVILCEDTRVTKKLLNLISDKFSISFPNFSFISVHSHNEYDFLQSHQHKLLYTKNVAYMSDAGMPCVSDPGGLLVDFCLKNNIKYDILPGANAVLLAYSLSGFNNVSFSFFGFLPHKGIAREQMIDKILNHDLLSIIYESPHRLLKLLEQLTQKDPTREIFLAKELTKKYQTIYKDNVKQIYNTLKNETIKGEWVVVIKQTSINTQGVISYDDIMQLSLPPKQKAKLLSKLTNKPIKQIYNELI